MKKVAQYANGIGAPLDRLLGKDGSPLALVKDAKAQKLLIHAYTLRFDQLPSGLTGAQAFNQIAMLLQKVGVDGVFTDHADRLIETFRLTLSGK
jgi:glycerophosphoryl diester phosphodiesterase